MYVWNYLHPMYVWIEIKSEQYIVLVSKLASHLIFGGLKVNTIFIISAVFHQLEKIFVYWRNCTHFLTTHTGICKYCDKLVTVRPVWSVQLNKLEVKDSTL